MKRQLFLLFNFLLFITAVKAAPVDEASARSKAQRFVTSRYAAARGTATSTPNLRLENTTNGAFYIFNNPNGGFVIVSADDRTPEILGYSDEGQFDSDNVPDNMRAWLQSYADQIKAMPETAEARQMSMQRKVAKVAIAPLLQTAWDQNNPYNLKCPNFINGEKSITGCVATAMAQVLYYTASNSSGFPSATTKEIPSYEFAKKWSGEPLLMKAIDITTFNWNNMLPSYLGSTTTEQQEAIADLMICCGASVEMDYADQLYGGSSASVASIPHAFKTYFGFDNSVKYMSRSLCSTNDWEDAIYNELTNQRPVLYGGQSSGGGHAFVCDGYDGDGHFHINWGWSGDLNGFFLLSALNPYGTGSGGSSSSDGYSMDQDIVIGIQAPSGNNTEEEVRMTVELLKLQGDEPNIQPKTYQNSLPIIFRYKNNLSDTYDVNIGYGIYNEDEELVQALADDSNYSNLKSGVWQSGTATTPFDGSSLANGTYKIKPISKKKSTETWYKCIDADRYYILAVVTDTEITMTSVNPKINLTASGIALTTDGVVNTTQTVSAIITNNATDRYNASIYLFVDGNKVSGNGISVEADAKTLAYFCFIPKTAGEKTVTIALDEEGTNTIGTGTISITNPGVSPNTPREGVYLDVVSITDGDENSHIIDGDNNEFIDVYNNSTTATIRITNNSSESYNGVRIVVAKYNESNKQYEVPSSYSYCGDYVINANTSYNPMVIENIASGYGKYQIRLYKNSSVSSENLLDNHFHFELTKGYAKWLANGDKVMKKASGNELTIDEEALSVELNDEFTDVHPNSNPNTLYIINSGSTPSSLNGKNIITGSTAEKIELTDGYNFATPIDFFATKISYKRTIANGTDGTGNGWTTIVLPFTVDEVTANETPIDWFHSSTDKGKNFWVRKFVNDQTDGVTFDFADQIEANIPYIFTVPGDHWGDEWDLTGKELVFKASNATIHSGSVNTVTGNSFKMSGIMKEQTLNDVYTLNETGTTFSKTTGTVAPFRAYFKSLSLGSATSLGIFSANYQTTAIQIVSSESTNKSGIYTLDGRKLEGDINNLPRGLYIVNGKKIIK